MKQEEEISMPIKELSLGLENVPGKLSQMNDYLSDNGVKIVAINVSEGLDMSAIRLVASDPEKAGNVLKTHGYSVLIDDALAIEVPNHPGGFHAVLKSLKEASVNVRHLYACLGTGNEKIIILNVDKTKEAIHTLKKNWINTYDEELYNI